MAGCVQLDSIALSDSGFQSSSASFENYVTNGDGVKVAAIFTVDLYMGVPWSWADYYKKEGQRSCEENYPGVTKTVPDWTSAFRPLIDDSHDMDLTINSSFYAANNLSYSKATCALNMGFAAVRNYQAPTYPQDCKGTCHPIDTLFFQYLSAFMGSRAVFSDSDHAVDYYSTYSENVLTAVGGIYFVQDGKFVDKKALTLHRPNDKAARMAIAVPLANPSSITIVYVPKGFWKDGEPEAPGLTARSLANLITNELHLYQAIMLDGGGSATMDLPNVNNWSGPETLPSLKAGEKYRPVGNALGFSSSGIIEASGRITKRK